MSFSFGFLSFLWRFLDVCVVGVVMELTVLCTLGSCSYAVSDALRSPMSTANHLLVHPRHSSLRAIPFRLRSTLLTSIF